ncbi:MAG TPA: sulfatase-like hydrolase/transferase [Actinomycetota bacterium]|nr:sulfatase-like hydrolase/transferase [Actinomycetota bacterium]
MTQVAWPGGGSDARAPAPAGAGHPHVVVIVLDELPVASVMRRDGLVDAATMPNLARLASDGTWFRNATTTDEFTKLVMPSLLAGRYRRNLPDDGRVPNLFTMLRPTHDIRANDGSPSSCPLADCMGNPDPSGLDLGAAGREFAHNERGAPFVAFVRGIRASDEPALHYVHLVMPHSPWRYLRSGQQYDASSPVPGEWDAPGPGRAWRRQPWLVAQAYQRHLMQVQFVDELLGVVLTRLEDAGLYDASAIVLTADHGIAFAPGRPKRAATRATAAEIAAVPLLVKRPFQADARVSDLPVELVDVVPTIAHVVGVARPGGVDGKSVFGGRISRRRARSIAGLSIDPDGLRTRRVVRAKYAAFASGGVVDPFRLAPGTRESLLGVPVEDLDVDAARTFTATVESYEAHVAAGPDDDLFPSLLEGTMTGDGAGRRRVLAIAVGGRVAAVTKTYRDGDAQRFYAMTPPTAYAEPPNEIALYALDQDDPERAYAVRIRSR